MQTTDYKNPALRTRQPPGAMWHAYVQELLERVDDATGGRIYSSDEDRHEAPRRAA
jgi:hypothetical protein